MIGKLKLLGNAVKTFCRATGPPVEVPIANNLYDLPDALLVTETAGFAAGVVLEVTLG